MEPKNYPQWLHTTIGVRYRIYHLINSFHNHTNLSYFDKTNYFHHLKNYFGYIRDTGEAVMATGLAPPPASACGRMPLIHLRVTSQQHLMIRRLK